MSSESVIQKIVVLGLRCSGTNYVSELIRKNYPNLMVTEGDRGIWKHMWQGEKTVDEATVEAMSQATQTLYIFLARNVFEWLQSFNKQPHHCLWARGLTMMQLLKTTPFQSFNGTKLLETYPSILEERKQKHRHIVEKVFPKLQNALLLQYETVRDDPSTLCQLLERFGILSEENFENVSYYKQQKETTYVPKKYLPLGEEEKQLILSETDWEIESNWNFYPDDNCASSKQNE